MDFTNLVASYGYCWKHCYSWGETTGAGAKIQRGSETTSILPKEYAIPQARSVLVFRKSMSVLAYFVASLTGITM